MLIRGARGVGGVDIAAVDFGAVLADFEFAFDARDGNAEAHDAGKHGAAESVGKATPLIEIGRVIGFNQTGEQGVFTRVVFDEFEGAEGVNGDVVPCGDGQLLGIERRADVAVRTGEDDKGFAVGEGLPVSVGFREVAFKHAVGTVIFDDEGEMGGAMWNGDFRRVDGAEEDGKGVGAHGLEESGAIGDLVEFGCVHGTMFSKCKFIVASLPGLKGETWGTQFLWGMHEDSRLLIFKAIAMRSRGGRRWDRQRLFE